MHKLLAISASPRRHGNSETLLDEFIKGAEKNGAVTDKIILADYKINPCTECLFCTQHAKCQLDDDMQKVLYPALIDADLIVISTPVFFMGPPAHLKAMIDRCQLFWAWKYVFKKSINPNKNNRKGFLLTLGALSENIGIRNFQGNINSIKAFYHVLGVKNEGYLEFYNIDKNGDILLQKIALEKAYKAGEKFVLLG